MNERVKREFEIQVKQINRELETAIDIPTKELITMHFNGIRMLIDYCEQLALEGEAAIEEL